MKISAVLATWNRREALAACLRTLLEQDIDPAWFEIVVVVDGSSDGTTKMLRELESHGAIVVVEQKNQGQTAALNAGVRHATGEILLFLDDDLLCDPGLLSAHRSAHLLAQKHGRATLVFGRTNQLAGNKPDFAETGMRETLEKYNHRLSADPQPKWPDDAWAGPNCSVPRTAFLAAGGYDEELFPRRGEDVDLGARLWKSGVRFVHEPAAIVWHRWIKSGRQMWADALEDGACSVRLCRRHPELRPHSPFARLMNSLWRRRIAGKMAPLFAGFSRLPHAGRIGMRLFVASQTMAMLAGASREAGSWRALVALLGGRLPVLLYHHVGPPVPNTEHLSLTVTPENFRRQMRWLRWRGYTPVSASQWRKWLERGEALPGKPILLTFDDAYADIATYALPVLEQYGLAPGVVFAITGNAGTANPWDGLPLMTMEQLRYWAGRGVEIGAHTRTHPDLVCASDDAIRAEVAGSKYDLEQSGLTPVSFAYPYGAFDQRVRAHLDGIFPLAFTCEEGVNELCTDPLLLRRTMVQPGDSIVDIELRAAFGWSAVNFVRCRLRIRSRVRRVLRILRILPPACP